MIVYWQDENPNFATIISFIMAEFWEIFAANSSLENNSVNGKLKTNISEIPIIRVGDDGAGGDFGIDDSEDSDPWNAGFNPTLT